MAFRISIRAALAAALAFTAPPIFAAAEAEAAPQVRGTFNFAATASHFDVSPPLRDIPVIPPPDGADRSPWFGALMIDPDPQGKVTYGPQDRDARVQDWAGPPLDIPAPLQNFNVGTGTANPPDPVGDVSDTHYVRMSNSTFQIFNKTGTSQFGPAAINTLFAGFGGACQTENAGDPVVLYDQIADRWFLTQFTSAGPAFFVCVAVSMTSDPTGQYFRYAFPTASFPDYPKFGLWPNAFLMTTREVNANSIGVYAIDRAQMLAGNPTPTIISFVNPLLPATARFLGDGLLPADLDGDRLPPAGSPAYFIGSMDNGGPYGATEDALALWKFDINFANPPASTFILAPPIRIASYDTIYPCTGRSCIPQPAPLGAVDILSYRQRPMHRAAYRNYGSYESLVTNQSVEASTAFAGIRWWELRNLGGATAVLYQDSTFAPADGVQRWMGSIAADSSGNIAMGYSAGGTLDFPGIRYTGRLESDPLGTMPQGEGIFVTGTGGHTAATRRWGDYTSMNVDSADDCTFWYINEFFAVSGTQWTLRAGSFKFPDCGTPSFGIAAVPLRQQVCTPNNATITVDAHGYNGFSGGATLAASGQPAGTTATFSMNPIVSVPGTSTLTIGNTGAAAPGTYTIGVAGTGGTPSASRSRSVVLDVFTAAPGAPAPTAPAADAVNASLSPLFTWNASSQPQSYVLEVSTSSTFASILHTSPVQTGTSYQLPTGLLAFSSRYYWRVRPANICGDGTSSAVRTFITRPQVGQCGAGTSLASSFFDNMENGINGWVTDPVAGTTWTQSTARPFSGARSWLAVDVAVTSDQRLISPIIALPANQQLLTLRFKHDVTMEPDSVGCFDGGFVEVSTNAGANWTALPASSVLQDFYDGGLPGGNQAWCGTQPYTSASLDIGSFAGQNVQFRFRAITDSSVGSVPHGWYVDDVSVVGCAPSDALFMDGFEEL